MGSLLSLCLVVVAVVSAFHFMEMAFVGNATPALRSSRGLTVRFATKEKASEETFGKLAGIVAEQLGVDEAKVIGTATLTELGADSLDIVETVMALEEGFDVELPDDETTSLKNVQDVADLIQSKLWVGEELISAQFFVEIQA